MGSVAVDSMGSAAGGGPRQAAAHRGDRRWVWRSGRTGMPSGPGVAQALGVGSARQGEKDFARERGSHNAQGGVMMKAAPAPSSGGSHLNGLDTEDWACVIRRHRFYPWAVRCHGWREQWKGLLGVLRD